MTNKKTTDKAEPLMDKPKPTIYLDGSQVKNIEELVINDEVVVKAVGVVRMVSSDESMEGGKRTVSARIELKDIEIENVSDEDRKDAEDFGIEDLKKVREIKKLRDGK